MEQDRMGRIAAMERLMEEVEAVRAAGGNWVDLPALETLATYYESPDWMEDYDADGRGEVPRDMKRGVLSQDGLWELLCDAHEVRKGSRKLLIDGREAFPEILRCIDAARESIHINMFIWRDDEIGNRLAAALLRAAERGVQVTLSIDRYGVVLEKSEECKRSFFHKTQTLSERVKSATLCLLYPMANTPRRVKDEETPLYRAVMSHPNIRVERDTFKADHSKFYVFDGETVILGGINVEDKENGADRQGRTYQDYMVRLDGKAYVEALQAVLRGEAATTGPDWYFAANVKGPRRVFGMEEAYLRLIREAREEVTVTMAYFSPLPQFVDALVAAAERGTRVTVLLPERANYQSDTNRRTAEVLMGRSGGRIRVLFSPKMLHTKLMANEHWVSFGSTNITKKAFGQLSELNVFFRRDTAVAQALMESVRREQALGHEAREVRYNRLLAWLEGFLV